MNFKILSLLICVLLVISCSTAKKIEKKLTLEERSVYELIGKLKTNPEDKDAANQLRTLYDQVHSPKKRLTLNDFTEGSVGDRWLKLSNEYTVLQKLYDALQAVPAAANAVPHAVNYSDQVEQYRKNAAEEFYNTGLLYLNYNNRPYAKKALDMFLQADKAVKGYKDVNNLLMQARETATLKVVVQPVDYHNYSWGYWGFQNDWLQQRMIQDLNAMSFSDVRFYSEWEARSKNIHADRLVTMRLIDLYIGNVNTESYSYKRSAQVETGATTKSNPPKPIYKTVYATVHVTKKTMMGRSDLECRIYSATNNYSVLSDHYPGNYRWQSTTATYTGDSRALTPEDRQLINNRFPNIPGRTEVAEKIINDSYSLLLSRIRSGVNFGN